MTTSRDVKPIGHQKQIKQQLSAYLKQSAIHDEKDRNIELAEALISHGFCYGFTLVDALLEDIGMLEWWEEVLKALVNWKGNKGELQNKITLPNEDGNTVLDNIFFKVLNFVLYHFASQNPKEMIPIIGLTQSELLKLNNKFLEVAYKAGKNLSIKQVINRATATGEFTTERWCALINRECIQGNICLIHSENHMVRISYNIITKKWLVYNPNYPIEKIHRYFDNEIEAYKELVEVLETSTMAIDLIALGTGASEESQKKEKQFSSFNSSYAAMLKSNPFELINPQENFMMLMMKYQPDALSIIISNVFEKKDDQEKKINILCDGFKKISKKKKATNLYAMLEYAPQCFNEMIQFVAEEKDVKLQSSLISVIGECLIHKTASGKRGVNLLDRLGLTYNYRLFQPAFESPGRNLELEHVIKSIHKT